MLKKYRKQTDSKAVSAKKIVQANELKNKEIFKKSYFGSIYVNRDLIEKIR